MISGLGKYLEGPGKSNNPFVIERVKIPGTHYKISSMDYQAANVWNHRKSGIIYDICVGSCCYEIKTLLIMIEWLIDQKINLFYR
jgi:hypothetical protein